MRRTEDETESREIFSYNPDGYYSQYGRENVDKKMPSENETKERERQLKWKSIRKTIRQFLTDTTAHGVPRTVSAKSVYRRVFWICIIFIALMMNLMHLSLLVTQYLRFPSEEVTKVQYGWVEFPSVTLCNIKAMSTTQKYDVMLRNTSSKFYVYTQKLKEFAYFLENNATHIGSKELEKLKNLYEAMRTPEGYFTYIGPEEAKLAGQTAQDMILSCKFNFMPCSWQNFTYYQHPTFYNCYTFNGKMTKDSLVTRTTGPMAGLSLIIYLEADVNGILNGSYYKSSPVENAGGLRVVVHSPQTRPAPVDSGVDVPPGYSTSAKVNVINMERLSAPVGNCTNQVYQPKLPTFYYNRETCMLLCQQEYVMKKCGCQTSTLPTPLNIKSDYCGNGFNLTRLNEKYKCVMTALRDFACNDTGRTQCYCNQRCLESVYRTDVSYSYWPLDYYQASFFNTYVRQNPNRNGLKAYKNLSNFTDDELIKGGHIRRNFLRFNIFMQELSVEQRREKQGYELQNLFSDIGGTLGLWIGVSIITIIELIELLIKVVMKACGQIGNGSAELVRNEESQRGNCRNQDRAWHISFTN
ncbi:FMRFamide-activated amiloride-sensitive sodium channel-like [Tubulanus polymorphus]|uniref:FMRFamide-activated amiloride-sensitive sodium channel-like n=1 Tax=Tubulanus polymorphus TaxID=672921 RepID=UPI003DA48C7C